MATQTPSAPILVSVQEAARRLGISRAKTYELLAAGEIEALHIGRRRLVPLGALLSYVERLRALASEGAEQ